MRGSPKVALPRLYHFPTARLGEASHPGPRIPQQLDEVKFMPLAAVQTPGEDAATLNALLDRARAVGPVLIEHRDHAEKNGALAEPAVGALHEAGLLKLWRPASLGGFEVDPVTYAIV